MSWHPKINLARQNALKQAAEQVKSQTVEERLAAIEQRLTSVEHRP